MPDHAEDGLQGDLSLLKNIRNHNQVYNHITAQTRLDSGKSYDDIELLRRLEMQQNKTAENKAIIKNQRTKSQIQAPDELGLKVRKNLQAGSRKCPKID